MASCPSDMLQAQEGLDSKPDHLLDGRAGSLKMHTTLRVTISPQASNLWTLIWPCNDTKSPAKLQRHQSACGVQHDTCMSPDTMQDVSLQGVGQLSSGHRSLEQP